MQSNFFKNTGAEARWLVIPPLSQEDSVAVAALRSVVAPMKGAFEGFSQGPPGHAACVSLRPQRT
jgi:hypothetical protein